MKAFTSVLIVACPCALALAAPFALGTAQRVLSRRSVYLKHSGVCEALARVDAVVFDKTGTLTRRDTASITFCGVPLRKEERMTVLALARQSTHPQAARIRSSLEGEIGSELVENFSEIPGGGMRARCAGREWMLGSARWLAKNGVPIPSQGENLQVHVAINGVYRGAYSIGSILRPDLQPMVERLRTYADPFLLSGDNDRDRERFRKIFGQATPLKFNQSPHEKLEFIRRLQSEGQAVMMVGDGLNDAGALQQSNVGVAVVESLSAFSPACDVILAADKVPCLPQLMRFSKHAVRVVRVSFLISSLYNALGIGIAASGNLAPIVCAILMPLSSISVVCFACGMTALLGRGLLPATAESADDASNTDALQPAGAFA